MAYIFCNIRASQPLPLSPMSMYHSPSPQCSRFPKVLSPLPPMSNPPNVSVFPPMSRFVFWLWGAQLKKWVSFFFIEGHPSMTILTLGRWKFRLWGGAVCQLLWWPFDFGGGRLTSASPREHFKKKQKYMCFEFVSFLLHTPIPFWRVALTRSRCTLCDDWRSDKVPRTPKKIGHHPAFCYIIYWRVPMLLGGAWPLCYLCYRKKRQS